MACTNEDPRDNVRPGMLEAFDKAELFENPASQRHQSGLLKLESTHTQAYFRNLKTYFLGGEKDDEADCVRVRGIPRKTHSSIPKSKFGCYDNDLVVRNMALRPTLGFQIGIFRESKALAHSANLKRFSCVSRASAAG
jgi:hypothetical protein